VRAQTVIVWYHEGCEAGSGRRERTERVRPQAEAGAAREGCGQEADDGIDPL